MKAIKKLIIIIGIMTLILFSGCGNGINYSKEEFCEDMGKTVTMKDYKYSFHEYCTIETTKGVFRVERKPCRAIIYNQTLLKCKHGESNYVSDWKLQ